jgi:phage shock protein PspC (stress-responsive transcriptional regulator)
MRDFNQKIFIMKKIININLSGRVIPIEDTAYEKLQAYIESLRRYFANEDGKDEIINDIESRIAELMNEKVRKGASAVTDEDIEEIIAAMGRVEDFEAADKENADTTTAAKPGAQQEYTYTKSKGSGRLYRDTNDKFIGGVCSGIAAYMNVDPAIVRILFAIVTFGGFGLGFLAYIILWMVLPPADLDGYRGKRLYRNPDDRVIGGVAGGVAAYFGKKASIIRLIFAAPLLLSILIGILHGFRWGHDFNFVLSLTSGSLSGTFFLTYVILWMVLPEANSEFEKMEMRGEKVDVNRIRQNVKEGMDNMKDRVKSWSEEVKETAQNFSNKAKEFSNTRGKAFASDVNETIRRRGGGIGHAIGVMFKAFFLFIFGTIAFAIFVSLIAMLFGGIAWWPINNFLWTSKWQQWMGWGTLVFFLLVPLIAFIVWIIRRIVRVKSRSNYLSWTFGGLWTIGWIVMILFVSSIVKDFREYEHTDNIVPITQPAKGKMIVAVSQPELEYTGNFGWMNDGRNGWDLSSDTLKIGAIKLTVHPSVDSQYQVTVKRWSFGQTRQDAISRAEKTLFATVYRGDSLLDLGNGYAIDKDSKFRMQNVEIEILVPVGKKIRFDGSVREKLNSLNINVNRGRRRDRISGVEINTNDNDFRFRSNVDYVMGLDGELKDISGSAAPVSTEGYRYPATDSATKKAQTDDIQQQLDEAKRLKEENDRKIKELEEKKKAAQSKPTGFIKVVKQSEANSFAGGPSPVSSLVEWF